MELKRYSKVIISDLKENTSRRAANILFGYVLGIHKTASQFKIYSE